MRNSGVIGNLFLIAGSLSFASLPVKFAWSNITGIFEKRAEKLFRY